MQKSTKGRVKSPMETAKESSLRKPSELLGAAKCSPVPGKHLPATIPSAIGETTHPPTRRKGTPRPKPSRKQYCKRSERASDDNVLTEGSEEEQLPWRREAQRVSEACFCGGGGGARRTQCGEAKREGEWEGKEGKWGVIMERRGRMRGDAGVLSFERRSWGTILAPVRGRGS